MKQLIAVICLLCVVIAPAAAQESADLAAVLAAVLDDYARSNLSAGSTAAIAVRVSAPSGDSSAATGLRDGVTPAQPDDRFRIASMSKTFVAVTALRMAEAGLLSLDDRAADYLPETVVSGIANLSGPGGATLRHLLAMQSGIDDYLETDAFWEVIDTNPDYRWTAAEALSYADGLAPLFVPGTAVSYSNTNYLLAELALSAAGGAPLPQLVRRYVLDPLDLADTYTQSFETLPDRPASAFVRGYEDWDGDGFPEDVSAINDGFGLGDGALISTTADIAAFYRALLLDRTLLGDKALAEMFSFSDDGYGGYGLGLEQWSFDDYGTAYGHSGAVLGFTSIGVALPEAGAVIVVLCATAECDPEAIALSAAEVALGG